MTTIAQIEPVEVVVGVDTHLEVHVAVALDHLGRRLGERHITATTTGYAELLAWAEGFGPVAAFGVEGTGSYGAGLTRFLTERGQQVVEVIRPNRQTRRRHGKSDPADAEAAARAVISGEADGSPKGGNGPVEAIRVLRIARSTARKARTQAINALNALVVTAPDDLREALAGLSAKTLAQTTSELCSAEHNSVASATRQALASLGDRYLALDEEIADLDESLDALTAQAAPALLELFGVGPDSAGALLVAAGDQPQRLRSEAAFAMLCGVGPLDASSGKQQRHRLNRGGNRQANAALYRIVVVRLRHHQPTRDYMTRRLQEGKTKPEIIRCLKRYVAREVHTALKHSPIHQTHIAA